MHWQYSEAASRGGPIRSENTRVILRSLACLFVTLLSGCAPEPRAQLSFNETIQPILSENCYGCHGPDSSSRKAGLRLDRAESAYAPHEKFGPAIVPGKPDRSPLIHRIEAKD